MPRKRKKYSVYSPTKVKSQLDGKLYYHSRFTYYDELGNRKQGVGDMCKTQSEALKNAEEKAYRISERKKDISVDELTIKEITKKYIEYESNLDLEEARASSKYTKVSDARSLVLGYEREKLKPQTPKDIIDKKIKNLTTDDISEWVSYISKLKSDKTGKKLSKVSIDKKLNSMRCILAYSKDLGCFKNDTDRFDRLIEKINLKSANAGSSNNDKPKASRKERFMNDRLFRKFMATKDYPNGYMANKGDLSSIGSDYPFYWYEPKHQKLGDELDREYMYYILFSTFYYSGARTAEIKALTTDDVEIEWSVDTTKKKNYFGHIAKIHINKSFCDKCLKEDKAKIKEREQGTKTESSERIIGILDFGYALELKHYIEYLDKIYGTGTKLLFPGKKVKYISDNAIDTRIKKQLKNVPELEKFSKHDFRRSRVTIFLNNGIASKYLEGYFGHNSTRLVENVYNAQTAEDKYANTIQNFDNSSFVSRDAKDRISDYETEKLFKAKAKRTKK